MVAKFPQINVYIQPGYSAQLYGSVENGDLDAAFVLQAPYDLPKTCDWQLLREEPLIVLAPAHKGYPRWAVYGTPVVVSLLSIGLCVIAVGNA